ncbi:helix-turn-helix domain-containing protein [Sphingomonas sp. RP10(2022)]|uniref:Helix-turn-helix domain-containing protein n=1 Tax=Sphingomonas liriopis TaxID=2949094 RepID=A0A9X2HQ77_9SPHN|nr:helix-turn-helix domain-containing protein [Sphingomonas liriopis]MCP3733424.1 helix-turn-helix domain-containing protein [Sphingomonas liriopis]
MTETVSKSVMRTDAIPPALRPEAYQAEISNTLMTTFLTEPVMADMRSCYLGALHVIELVASPRRSERTGAQIARDRHDGISIQLALRGTARGEAGGRKVASVPGTVMLLDFAQPFHMVDEGEREVINVSIPRAMLAPRVTDLRALHGRVLDAEAGALLAAHLTAVAPRLERLPAAAAPVLGDILLQLVLLAVGDAPEEAPLALDRRTSLLQHARRLIDARLGSSDLTPEWLFARLNISRSDLYTLFEDAGGVVRYIWKRRLEAAREALINPADSRRISEIAFHFGFSSEAHFARAYRTAFGKTASETRRSGG